MIPITKYKSKVTSANLWGGRFFKREKCGDWEHWKNCVSEIRPYSKYLQNERPNNIFRFKRGLHGFSFFSSTLSRSQVATGSGSLGGVHIWGRASFHRCPPPMAMFYEPDLPASPHYSWKLHSVLFQCLSHSRNVTFLRFFPLLFFPFSKLSFFISRKFSFSEPLDLWLFSHLWRLIVILRPRPWVLLPRLCFLPHFHNFSSCGKMFVCLECSRISFPFQFDWQLSSFC